MVENTGLHNQEMESVKDRKVARRFDVGTSRRMMMKKHCQQCIPHILWRRFGYQ